jgi:hypothetical protein
MYDPGLSGRERSQKYRDQRPEVGEPIRPGLKHDHGNRKRWQVLLKGKVAIDGYENVEELGGEAQQFPVINRRPTHLASRLHLVADNVTSHANQRTRREKPSRGRFDHPIFRLLQESDHMLPTDSREPFEKIVDRPTRFQIVKQCLHGNSGSVECSSAPMTEMLRETTGWFMPIG